MKIAYQRKMVIKLIHEIDLQYFKVHNLLETQNYRVDSQKSPIKSNQFQKAFLLNPFDQRFKKTDNFENTESSNDIIFTANSSEKNENLDSFILNRSDIISNFKNTIATSQNAFRFQEFQLLNEINSPTNKRVNKNSSSKGLMHEKIEDMKKIDNNRIKEEVLKSFLTNFDDHRLEFKGLNEIPLKNDRIIPINNSFILDDQLPNSSDRMSPKEIYERSSNRESYKKLLYSTSNGIDRDNFTQKTEIINNFSREINYGNTSIESNTKFSINNDDKSEKDDEYLDNLSTYKRNNIFDSKENIFKSPIMQKISINNDYKSKHNMQSHTTINFEPMKTIKNQGSYSKLTDLTQKLNNYTASSHDFGEDFLMTRSDNRSKSQSPNEKFLNGATLNLGINNRIKTNDYSITDDGEDGANMRLLNIKKTSKLDDTSNNKQSSGFIYQNYSAKDLKKNKIEAYSQVKAGISRMEITPSKIKNDKINMDKEYQPKRSNVSPTPKDFTASKLPENLIYKQENFSKTKSSVNGSINNKKLKKIPSISSTQQKGNTLKMEVQEGHKKVIQEIKRLKNSSKSSSFINTKPKNVLI